MRVRDPAYAVESLTEAERRRIEEAVERGIAAYIESRKAKIPEFIERHFSWRGAYALRKKTLGRDACKVPLNVLWSLPAFLAHSASRMLGKLGADRLSRLFAKMPPGLKTGFQQEINWLIQTELLELPCSDGARESSRDALLEAIFEDAELAAECARYLESIGQQARSPDFRERLEAQLAEYGKSNLAISDLATNLMTLAAGYAAFQQATPGAVSAGTATATLIAQHLAIAHFWLGPTLGAWYYSIFPASASLGLIAATTGAVMAATGILAALSLVFIDPLLAKTGFHRRRLERFVQALEEELAGRAPNRYQVRDHYLARVFDLVELLKLAARAAR